MHDIQLLGNDKLLPIYIMYTVHAYILCNSELKGGSNKSVR